jgi:hypothetical protein
MTRPVSYAINVTLDGWVHHEAGLPPGNESTAFWTDELRRSDTLLCGRVVYELMEGVWCRPGSGEWPGWMDDSEVASSEVMDPLRKVLASASLDAVDWNAQLFLGDVVRAVRRLKERPGRGIELGGVKPPMLAAHGLIGDSAFVVHSVVAGRGFCLLAGIRDQIHLELVEQRSRPVAYERASRELIARGPGIRCSVLDELAVGVSVLAAVDGALFD